MEKDIILAAQDAELRCPHCGGAGLTLRRIHIHQPSDGIVLSFDTKPTLALCEIDGADDDDGYVALTVDCPHCSPKGDGFYLSIRAGKTSVGDDIDEVRVHWSTDREGDPASVSNQILQVLKPPRLV